MSDNGDLSEAEQRERARLERLQIVHRYDRGREEGAEIDDWEDPKLEIYHMQDRYGFIHDKRLPDTVGRSERDRKQIQVEMSRSQKWAEMFKQYKKFFGPNAKNREKMISRVYKGVPDRIRGRLWYILLDIEKLKEEQKGVYQKMRHLARLHSPDIRQIDLDVNRTYRDHVMFRERYNQRQQALFHVLAAYSMYNSEVGYCQGMSQIAALLLMYLNEEEDVFWALSQLMVNPKYQMHGFFIHGFPKLIRFQTHHDKILKKFLPKLKKHLDKNGIDSGIYTLKWFFQCFLDRIPVSLTLRVWDLYLLEGERVMIAMAYNILRMHRRYIMKLGMDEIIEHLQMGLEKDFGFEDDHVIERLREVMHDLRSSRLDHPGRAPPAELPQRPFGLITIPPIEQEIGYRTGFTEKEREFSEHTIQRQNDIATRMQHEASLDEEPSLDQSIDDVSSVDEPLDASSPRLSVRLPPSPLPPSEAQDRLDDSLKQMILQAAEIAPHNRSADRSNGDTSFEADVVRIKVPYSEESDNNDVVFLPQKQKSPSTSSEQSTPRYEGNKILITVNHNASPVRTSPIRSASETPSSVHHEITVNRLSKSHSVQRTVIEHRGSPATEKEYFVSEHFSSSTDGGGGGGAYVRYDEVRGRESNSSGKRRQVRSYHQSSGDAYESNAVGRRRSSSERNLRKQKQGSPTKRH